LSFGSKLADLDLPITAQPGEEILATLTFTPRLRQFKREATIYLEETDGIRQVDITVKSASYEPPS
jgi:hypothetical protein